MTISERIADFALLTRHEDIPNDMLEYGKLLLLDTFGVAMSCQKHPHAQSIRAAIQELKPAGKARLWGTNVHASIPDAVLYNASLIHGADYDDTHVGGIVHPSAAVVATAVTVGEAAGSSGRDIMTSIVIGWEVMIRLALAASGRFQDAGYHCTGILAPFAAACVAGRLMGVEKPVLADALGVCGSQAAALQEFLQDGAWTKKIHPGWGCHSAVYALLMAKNGFRGPKTVFEGRFGLWQTHLGSSETLEEQMADLGAVWHIKEIAFKMYPICHMSHSFVDCMLALQHAHAFSADDIESIVCRIESRCFHVVASPRDLKVRPHSDYMMRFSLPFVVAVAAVAGRMSPWEIDLKYAYDPKIQSLMDRITCIEDDTKRHPGYFPGWVEVHLKDGSTYMKEQLYELGTPKNPIQPEDVLSKYYNNMSAFYTKEVSEEIAMILDNLTELPSVTPLLDQLAVNQ